MAFNVFVGIVIIGFGLWGMREGVAKAIGSIAAVFVALFLAASAVNFLAKANPLFGNPSYPGTTVIFFLVWLIAFVLLDLLIAFLFGKAVKIVMFGPLDVIAGIVIGIIKGMLICGIVLQLAFYMPISPKYKGMINDSIISRWSLSIYQVVYPFAKKIAPRVNDMMDKMIEGKKVETEQGNKAKELLEKRKIVPDAPQKKG